MSTQFTKFEDNVGISRAFAGPAQIGLVEICDCMLQAVAADEPHGVIGSAVVVLPESINGNNAGMLKPSCDLGFLPKAVSSFDVPRESLLDLFNYNLTIQLIVPGDKHLT
jgi:hypothetical protein